MSQRLSHILGRADGADGVCAGISFRNPHSLIAEITDTTDDDPWSPALAQQRILGHVEMRFADLRQVVDVVAEEVGRADRP